MKYNSKIIISLTVSFLLTALLLIILLILNAINNITIILAICLLCFFVITYLIFQFCLKRLINGEKTALIDNDQKEYGEPIEQIRKRDTIEYDETKIKEINLLRANEKFRKEFLGNISHELKTPIFNIQGYILTLLEGGLEDPSINMKYLERSEKSINRMILIVRDLEEISKLKQVNFI